MILLFWPTQKMNVMILEHHIDFHLHEILLTKQSNVSNNNINDDKTTNRQQETPGLQEKTGDLVQCA